VSWPIGGEGDQLLRGRRWGRLLVWERNKGNGEPWVCGRRPKQMGRGVGLEDGCR